MYLSKAMMNMRGDILGSTANPIIESPWTPFTATSFNAGTLQAGGHPISNEVQGAIVFSTGDTVTDDVWTNQNQTLLSLNSLRAYLAINLPNCIFDTAPISTGKLRVINIGGGKRVFDFADGVLGHFSYAKAFNRMYILIASNNTTIGAATTSIATVVELTPQDLTAMGAPLTDNGDGTFNLNGTIALNNIAFS